jgi:hypothetical protein
MEPVGTWNPEGESFEFARSRIGRLARAIEALWPILKRKVEGRRKKRGRS